MFRSIWQGTLHGRRRLYQGPIAMPESGSLSQNGVSIWPLPDVEKPARWISCFVHDHIPLYYPLETLVDSPEFQRLRRLKQVGLGNYVFPSAEHSRFTHSLGVYHLAHQFATSLRDSDPSLQISSEDVLCLSIAGLCHDIGHGPFSHMFDNELLKERNPDSTWNHEHGSIQLIDRLFGRKEVREHFTPYLGHGDRFDRNLTFIKELIHPGEKLDAEGKWRLQGRDQEKSYLYDIISNEEDGHDVDKYDYLMRDALHCRVDITFGMSSLIRIRNNMRVFLDEQKGYKRIAFAKKILSNLQSVGDSRQHMHRVVYQHYTCRAIERMLIRALLLADEHLMFTGTNGKRYPLSSTIEDMEAYLKTDDSILSMIENDSSRCPQMEHARDILADIACRRIPKIIESEDFSPRRTPYIWANGEHIPMLDDRFRRVIRKQLEDAMKEELPEMEIEILLRNLNRGLDGKRHPAGEVLVFDSKNSPSGQPVAKRVEQQQVMMSAPTDPTIMSVAVFAHRHATPEERETIRRVFDRVCRDNGLRSPNTSGNVSPNGELSSPGEPSAPSPVHW